LRHLIRTLAGMILLVGLIAYFYGNSVSKRILNLTAAADRISIGDLSTPIPSQSKDEIGVLAEAIRRMQASLEISVHKLKQRDH